MLSRKWKAFGLLFLTIAVIYSLRLNIKDRIDRRIKIVNFLELMNTNPKGDLIDYYQWSLSVDPVHASSELICGPIINFQGNFSYPCSHDSNFSSYYLYAPSTHVGRILSDKSILDVQLIPPEEKILHGVVERLKRILKTQHEKNNGMMERVQLKVFLVPLLRQSSTIEKEYIGTKLSSREIYHLVMNRWKNSLDQELSEIYKQEKGIGHFYSIDNIQNTSFLLEVKYIPSALDVVKFLSKFPEVQLITFHEESYAYEERANVENGAKDMNNN